MTLGEIITEITAEIGGDSTDTTLSSNLLMYCKASLRRLPKRVRDRSLVKIGSVSLSSGSQTASLPTDFLKERMVWYVNDGRRVEIDRVHFKTFNAERYSSNAIAIPTQYRIYGASIEFQAKADQNYTIYLEYFQALTQNSITTSSDFAMREDAVEAFKDLVKSYYYRYEEDHATARDYWAQGFAVFQEIDDEYCDEELGDRIQPC